MTTREKLIIATMEQVNECGLHNTPTSKIAKKAGFSEATIYKHFSSKEELLKAVYFKIKSDLDASLFIGTEEIEDEIIKLRKIWNNNLDYFLFHPEELRYYLQFTYSNYINKMILEEGVMKLHNLTSYWTQNIKKGIFKDLPLSFYHAFIHVPSVSLAKAVDMGELELTNDIREEAFKCIMKILDYQEK